MKIKNEIFFYSSLFFLFFVLIFNVGPIAEIHSAHNATLNKDFLSYIFPEWGDLNYYILNPFGYYLDYGYAKYLRYNFLLITTYKTIIIFISFLLYSIFFKKFLNFKFAIFLTLLIFLSPNSDSLIYSSTHRYLLGSSIVLFSFTFIDKKKYLLILSLLFLSILICYVSIIFIFGLVLFFAFKKNIFNLILYSIPFILFTIYYFIITSIFDFSKLNETFSIISLLKKSILIFLSYFDAGIGISFFAKIYSIFKVFPGIFLIIFIIFIPLIFYILNINNSKINTYNNNNIIDLIILTFFVSITSIIVFIVSFGYPYIVFGLGNRTNLFINIFSYTLFFFVFLKYQNNKILSFIFKAFLTIIIVSGITLNLHWKSFSKNTEIVVNSIKENCKIISLNNNNRILIFLSGFRYSKLDNFDHIEFLSPPWVANSFCDDKNLIFFSISNEITYDQSTKLLINSKYLNQTVIKDKDKFIIFDLVNKNIKVVKLADVIKMNKSSYDIRHWYSYSDKLISLIRYISQGKYE